MQARTALSEALAPLQRRIRDQQPTIRLVSQATFELRDDHAFSSAIRESVAWMRKRSPSIPQSAFSGTPFLVSGGGAHPAEAVSIVRDGSELWAAILDDPDSTVPRRTWVTEITIGKRNGIVAFGARLLNVTRGEDAEFEPSRPGLVRQLLSELTVVGDGRRLSDATEFVETDGEFERFLALLSSPTRRLPIVAISRTATGLEALEPERLAPKVSGLAHIFVLDERCSWRLTRELGKSLSVFLGAARIYNPGFSAATADPFEHPLWLVRDPADVEATSTRLRQITSRLFGYSVRSARAEGTFPRFDEIRQISAEEHRELAKEQGGTEAELMKLFEDDNQNLRKEIEKQRAEFSEAMKLNTEMIEITERERDEMQSDLYGLRSRIQFLEAAISSKNITIQTPHLGSYADIGEWTQKALTGNIWIAPKAIRETEKNGIFEDIVLFEKTLLLLHNYFVPMKRDPGREKREAYEAALRELHLQDERCFVREGDIQGFPAYSVTFETKKYWCNDHIKFGAGYDPRRMFRIYYYWHNESQILLIGHMPSHLDNKRTN